MKNCKKCGGFISEPEDFNSKTGMGIGGAPGCSCPIQPTPESKDMKPCHCPKGGMKRDIEKLIAEEMLICHKEGTPTSRLTSLANKFFK